MTGAMRVLTFSVVLFTAAAFAVAQDLPVLPEGLGDEPGPDLPTLPEGLGEDGGGELPSLPEGLEGEEGLPDSEANLPAEEEGDLADALRELGLRGFLDVRAGLRLRDDPFEKDASLGEGRLQVGCGRQVGIFRFDVVADLVYDRVADDHGIDLQEGRGWLDLRQASIAFSPVDFADVKVGRQVLTWGTGDLLFINDLFPKDWPSFFLGRDTEYLKAPSDAVKAGLFHDIANLDLVYTPRFDSDRHLTGERVSYWNAGLGRRAGRDAVIDPLRPDDEFRDDEFAARLYRTFGSVEVALYGYDGFFKSPAGMDAARGRATFPGLRVCGASVRGPLAGGIANVEFGYFDAKEDRGGDDPLVENSQLRVLVGYERDLPEVANDLTIGLQWYLESMRDRGAYERNLPPGSIAKDANRHVLTLRVSKRLLRQTLDLGLFAYVSPTDSDAYLRLSADYRIDDRWSVFAGLNLFTGAHDHTFFGQFERNTNVYLGSRWSF